MTDVALIRGDAHALPLPDASVDLICTSPPYWALRHYRDGGQHYAGQVGAEPTPAAYVAALLDCTRDWMRVLKPTGSLWINLGDVYSSGQRLGAAPTFIPAKSLFGLPWRYALRAVDELGLILRAEVVWAKPNGLPESVTDRVRRSHEQWFHLVKQPRYYAAVDEIREPHARAWTPGRSGGRTAAIAGVGSQYDGLTASAAHPLGALPGSVWEIPTQPLKVPPELGVEHHAAYPVELPRRIIAGWSPPGGLVLDPFGGTGTTGLAAKALGRRAISVDMSADYIRLAAWRTTDPGELARAMRVPKPAPVPDGQDTLFGGAA